MPDAQWKRLVVIHGHAKALILRAEELDQEQQLFVQPLLEIRSSMDHVLRAVAAELGINGQDIGYAGHNFDKAIGHVYRAFFDAADWLTIRIRDLIIEDVRRFAPSTVAAVAPDYYSTWRPQIEKIATEVGRLRENKDVAKARDNDVLLEEVERYRTAIESLMEIRRDLGTRLPAMHEHARRSMWSKYRFWIVTGALGATVVGLAIRYLAHCFGF